MNWIALTLITMVLWGIWGFLIKVSTKYMDWKVYVVVSGIISLVVPLAVFFYFKPEIVLEKNVFFYTALCGIIGVGTVIPYFLALESGKVSIVTTVAALYPIVTIFLSLLILNEQITLVQIAGMILALIAIILMSM